MFLAKWFSTTSNNDFNQIPKLGNLHKVKFISGKIAIEDAGTFIHLGKVYKEIINVIITKIATSPINDYHTFFWDNTSKFNTDKVKIFAQNINVLDTTNVEYTIIVSE